MGRYRIARVIDQFGWAYHFIAQEHAKYSKHEIIPVKYSNVDVENYDLIYIHSPDICTPQIKRIVNTCRETGVKVVGAYAGDPAYWASSVVRIYDHLDLAVGISPETYRFCKESYPDRSIFLPESVDDGFFVGRGGRDKCGFVVGWAGGLHKQAKRSHLLNKLIFPVSCQANWNPREFVEERNQNHMVDFYNEIDVLVLTSRTECQPRVVLEAMSCGKAVVATNVGSVKFLIPENFVVPKNPEDLMLAEMNKKLRLLSENKQMLIDVGNINRKHIEKCFSWKATVAYWDLVFENVISGNTAAAISVSEMYLKNNGLDKFLR